MKREYDYAVFIGRFQPFHKGHKAVIDKALTLADKVIVLIGSANLARSARNPFTYEERKDFIDSVYPETFTTGRIVYAPLNDYTYDNDGWIESVQKTVRDIVMKGQTWRDKGVAENLNDNKVTLIGRNKDNTSFYLKLFPNWSTEDVFQEDTALINATDIRQDFFEQNFTDKEGKLPVEVFNRLSKFRQTETFDNLRAEMEYCRVYKSDHAMYKKVNGELIKSEHEVTFNTVDAIIKCSGHILLVTRKARPGKGLLALPGGFLDPGETLFQSCVREVIEETKLNKHFHGYLERSLVSSRVFDDPHRDPRGRFITQAFYFDMGNLMILPSVKGGSDALKAQWVPIANLRADNMFADHYFIVRHFLNN